MLPIGKGGGKTAQHIMIALILGLGMGLLMHGVGLQHYGLYLEPISDIFLRLLRMIVVPLLISSIYMAMVGLAAQNNWGTWVKRPSAIISSPPL